MEVLIKIKSQKRFKSQGHDISTVKVYQNALRCNDNKRIWLQNCMRYKQRNNSKKMNQVIIKK